MFQREDDTYLTKMENYDYDSPQIIPTPVQFIDDTYLDGEIARPDKLTAQESNQAGTSKNIKFVSPEEIVKAPVVDKTKKEIGAAKDGLRRRVRTHVFDDVLHTVTAWLTFLQMIRRCNFYLNTNSLSV